MKILANCHFNNVFKGLKERGITPKVKANQCSVFYHRESSMTLLDLFGIWRHHISHLAYCSSPLTEPAHFEWGLEPDEALQPVPMAMQVACHFSQTIK